MRNIAEVHELLPGSSAKKLSKDLCDLGSWWRIFSPRAHAKDHIILCCLMMSNETRFSSRESTSTALACVRCFKHSLCLNFDCSNALTCTVSLPASFEVSARFRYFGVYVFRILNPPVVLQNQIAGASATNETIWKQCRPVSFMISC